MHRAAPQTFVLDSFEIGWDNVSASTSLKKQSLYDCKNFNLTPNKGLEKRKGIVKLYPTAAETATKIHSLYEYKAPNGSNYILTGVGTKLKAYFNALWNDLKIGLSDGKRLSFVTHQGFCYCVNGVDPNFKLYNTTATQVGIDPPTAEPGVAQGSAVGITGKYRYVYCYQRTTPNLLIGNPSPVSDEITVTDKKINVTTAYSSDPQVDKIVIYRTVNLLGANADSTKFYKVTEINNTDPPPVFEDANSDNALTTLYETDNDKPPKAKFICLHKDYIFYANCPDIEAGKALIVWSKRGRGEAVPALNYQYFDRVDGEEITGIASVGDYLLVFKRNKIAVLEGEFQNLYTLAYGVGNIAPWAILQFEDKVIFLSEEGWKACDGRNIYNLSSSIEGLVRDQYVTIDEQANYSAIYYPQRHQFQYLINHSLLTPMVVVGHFLVPLLFIDKGIPEQKSENLVGWTYHTYGNHLLTCLGYYTDSRGLLKIIAGTSAGFVYLLDTGDNDDTYNIDYKMSTGWLGLDTPESYVKTARRINLLYATSKEDSFQFFIDTDFGLSAYPITLIGTDSAYSGSCYCGYAYCGIDGSLNETIKINRKGKLFRYRIEGNNTQELTIQRLVTQFRVEGIR